MEAKKTEVIRSTATLKIDPNDVVIASNISREYEHDPAFVKALAENIKTNGLINPPMLRLVNGEYHVVAGVARVRACKLLRLQDESFRMTFARFTGTDEEAEEANIAENVQRNELSPVDLGKVCAAYRNKGLNNAEIAEKIGKTGPMVNRYLTIHEAPECIKRDVHTGSLSADRALGFCRTKNPEQSYIEYLARINDEMSRNDRAAVAEKVVDEAAEADGGPKRKRTMKDVRAILEDFKGTPLAEAMRTFLDGGDSEEFEAFFAVTAGGVEELRADVA